MEELDKKRYDAGLAVRRSVLGEEWVQKATGSKTEFTAEWQEFITRYAWGEIWTRPGIERRIRSYMTLSLMIALGRWEEFNLHVVAAFNNGLDEEDIKEIILHCACYCGVPAGNNAFAEATKTLEKIGRSPKPLRNTSPDL
jgi:4-carboxymuconolactone decarboxylase